MPQDSGAWLSERSGTGKVNGEKTEALARLIATSLARAPKNTTTTTSGIVMTTLKPELVP